MTIGAVNLAALPARRRRQLRLLRTIAMLLAVAAVTVWLRSPDAPAPSTATALPPPPAAPPVDEDAAPETPDAEPPRLAPLAILVPSIGVDAPIVPVGLLPGDVMEIPEDVAEIGWYDPDGLGVAPGLPGTAVFAGHVDSRSQGRGALYELRRLAIGDPIEVVLEDGTRSRWRVTEVIQYPKATLPYHEVFTWSGGPRLALITCGGEFDRTERSYLDNIVAYAEPESSSESPSSPSPA